MGSLASGVGYTTFVSAATRPLTRFGLQARQILTTHLHPDRHRSRRNVGQDWNGHVIGNSFLNSAHARFTGTIALNALGKYDLYDPTGNNNGNASKYDSDFQGYTCWQSPSSSSPAKTKADGSEITNKTECETLYGAGSWRSDSQGTCVTCHDVHNSLFVRVRLKQP